MNKCSICNNNLNKIEMSLFLCNGCNSYFLYYSRENKLVFSGINIESGYVTFNMSKEDCIFIYMHFNDKYTNPCEIYYSGGGEIELYDLLKSYYDNFIFE